MFRLGKIFFFSFSPRDRYLASLRRVFEEAEDSTFSRFLRLRQNQVAIFPRNEQERSLADKHLV